MDENNQLNRAEFYKNALMTQEALNILNREERTNEDNVHICIYVSEQPTLPSTTWGFGYAPVAVTTDFDKYFEQAFQDQTQPKTFDSSLLLDSNTGQIILPQRNISKRLNSLASKIFDKLESKRRATIERSEALANYNEVYDEE